MLSEERLRQAAHHAAQALEDSLPPPANVTMKSPRSSGGT